MSWVKEALRGGEEEGRKATEQQRTEELARQREAWQKASAQAEVEREKTRQIEDERREELAEMKHYLDERDALGLLRDVQEVLKGEIILTDSLSTIPVKAYTDNWVAYLLTEAHIGGNPVHHESGGYEDTYPSETQGGMPTTRSRGYIPYRRYKEIPVHVTNIVIGARHFFFGNNGTTTPIELFADAGSNTNTVKVFDIYNPAGEWGEIPKLLRGLPRIPGLISQRIEPPFPLLANGEIDLKAPKRLTYCPDGIKVELTDNPHQDSLGLRQILSQGLKNMRAHTTS